jgi:hypothetical protein
MLRDDIRRHLGMRRSEEGSEKMHRDEINGYGGMR